MMYTNLTPSIELLLNFMKEGALAFVLVFAIVYFLLMKINLFGTTDTNRKKINLIIALALAVAAITPHFTTTYYGYGYSSTVDIVEIINNALPNVSLLILGIVVLMIVLAVFGFNTLNTPQKSVLGSIVVLASLITVVYIFANAAGWTLNWDFLYWLDEDVKNLIVIIIVFGLIVLFITGSGGGTPKTWLQHLIEDVSAQTSGNPPATPPNPPGRT